MARSADPTRARYAATWIVRRLRDSGHTAYFAGGCVRDGLLGLHPTDFDVATDATPQRVRSLFPRTAEVGAAFGVVLVHVTPDDIQIPAHDEALRPHTVSVEVATFRSDGPYTDARRPDTVHFSDPKSDAERRDFTINALFLDPLAAADDAPVATGSPFPDVQGKVIDFVGGVSDLRRRVVRAVGQPDKRLAEDHLRALRAVRFAARLGFAIDEATAQAISRHAAELKGVSRERIGDELRRMLAHPSRAAALAMLQDLTLDGPVLNEPANAAALTLTRSLDSKAASLTALAAWVIDRYTPPGSKDPLWLSDRDAAALSNRWRASLCLSNEETDELESILRKVWFTTQRWSAMRTSERKRAATNPLFSRGLQIVRAWSPGVAEQVRGDVRRLATDGIGLDPEPLITGDDLVAAGLTPGPRFKGILDEVRDAQLEGKIRSKEEGMELARRLSV